MLNILFIGNKQTGIDAIIKHLGDHPEMVDLETSDDKNDVFDRASERKTDIILLECTFDNNKGIDFCYTLKNTNKTKHIPVVLINEEKSISEERTRGILAGADSFITKPIDKAELIAVINVMLRIKNAEDQLRSKNKELNDRIIKTSDELSKKERRYAAMFNAAANVIILIGKNKKIEEWNKAAEDLFELKRQNVIGQDFEKVILNKVMRADINDKISFGEKIESKNEYQINIKTATGKKYQILWTTSQLTDSKNQLQSILVIGQDVSFRVKEEQERKRSEARLLRNYLFLDALMNTLPSPMYYKSIDGRYLGCNSDFADFYGLKKEQIIGKYAKDINPLQLAEKIEEEDQQVFKKGNKQVKEVSAKYKNGKMHYFVLNKTAFYNPDKSIGGLVGVMVEITRQKQMEEELRESEMFFKSITDSANDAIILIDKQARVHFWNNAAEKLIGYTKEEIINELFLKVLPDEQNKKKLTDKLSEIQTGNTSSNWANLLELSVIRKNNTKFLAEFSISGIKIRKKNFTIIFVKDITLRKSTESTLLEAKEKAEEADRLKSAFLSNMSHEIRTPMNAIVGFSQLLANPVLDDEKKQIFIEQINLNSESLLQLIEDIIYVSKIEAGKIEIKPSMSLLNSVLDELHTSFIEHKKRMGKEHLELIVEKQVPNPNFSVLTDAQRFKQIMSNLIGNAIKFTEAGSVTFGYKVKDDKMLLFFVKDTGLGIRKEKHEYVFDRFSKISADKTKLYGGTGLGLSITQHLVQCLGGIIWLESEENKGATFYFTHPHQGVETESIIEKTEKTKAHNMSLKDTSILIAEDEQMNYFFLQEALSLTGANIKWAKNGKEAVQMIETGDKYDVVLMDMKMPVMDGYEATAKIKKIKPLLPIIAQTAYAMPDEQKRGFEVGCDYYLSKPVDPDLLIETIQRSIFRI